MSRGQTLPDSSKTTDETFQIYHKQSAQNETREKYRMDGSVKVCFTSDVHGNCGHLRRVLARATREGCDVVVLGGDLAPRGSGMGFDGKTLRDTNLPHLPDGTPDWQHDGALTYMRDAFKRQGEWFTEVLIPMLAACDVPSVCLFGNSDWKSHLETCRRAAASTGGHVRFVQGEGDMFTIASRTTTATTVDVMACSLVPLCNHKKKDWERMDTRDVRDTSDRAPVRWGFVSAPGEEGGIKRCELPVTAEAAATTSMEAVLERLIASCAEERKEKKPPAMWVLHPPPRDSIGDLTHRGERVGSIAIRRAIETHAPAVTLHGHIHESVEMHGGRFSEVVKSGEGGERETVIVSVGNDFKVENPYVIFLDTAAPRDARRVEVLE